MSHCSFCGSKEDQSTPLCQTCGTIRYPIANNHHTGNFSKQDKLKLSAILAAAIITPGSFVIMALLGANRIHAKIKNEKNS